MLLFQTLITIDWKPVFSPLFCTFLIFLATSFCYFAYRSIKAKMSNKKAAIILAPKILILVIILVAVFEPFEKIEKENDFKSKLLIMFDISSSMEVKDHVENRLKRAQKIVSFLNSNCPSNMQIDIKLFDSKIYSIKDLAIEKKKFVIPQNFLTTNIRTTNIAGCISKLSEQADISSYNHALFITDGGDESPENIASLPIPLHVIGIGTEPSKWDDLSISDIQFPSTVEQDINLEITTEFIARIASKSFAAKLKNVAVILEKEEKNRWKRIANKQINLSNKRASISFQTSSGKEITSIRYKISLANISGEVSTLNNYRIFNVNVEKKKIHVLYFSRELGMDFKTIRSELAQDPTISFTALFRVIGERFTIQGKRIAGDKNLETGFPSDQKILKPYNCIIIGSFPIEGWKTEQINAIIDYVEQGGNVIFLGGEH